MTSGNDDTRLLATALEQAGDLLGTVTDDQLDEPTPCREWTVGELVDHLVATPGTLATMMRGEQPDFGATPEHVGSDREQKFRASAADLLSAWHAKEDSGSGDSPADWQLAELAVHTWDLAKALGQPTDAFDAAVAERGLAFMEANLSDENRGEAFGPALPAPQGAGPYERIASFAGRPV